MQKSIFIIGLIAIVAIGAKGLYDFNKPHKNINKATADFALSSEQLFNAYSNDEAASNDKYLGKVVQLEGRIKAVSTEDVVKITLESGDMMFGVICEMAASDKHNPTPKVGDLVKIKGVCNGILMDVVLTNCHLINE